MQLLRIYTYHNNINTGRKRYSMDQRSRRDGNGICVKDALIEEIFRDRNAGYVTISYGRMGEFNSIQIMVVQLLVSQETVIQNQMGQKLSLRDLKAGMKVDAEFSNIMTASIPPIANAFSITALREKTSSNVKVDRVISVDYDNNFFLMGSVNDINNQIQFNVSPATIIMDINGNRVCISSIKAGQMVKVDYSSRMTFSIPPQTTAFRVQIL